MKLHHLVASSVMLAALLAGVAPARAALNFNSLSFNALSINALAGNALAGNALTYNAVTTNGVAPTGSALGELNGVAVEAVQAPERR